ncbi:hypothetical protein B0T26DRAFT_751223 [Lasiosphaeria miniovina]|uniref:Annexin ANXC4 n=1 Tax=Lasiosphaeria miniovina TaxID=1954250 RepID=A0AA40AJQ5_9PEZI|nr:uncharacterized protein B0T26DRAFT_751223 [Lasiosphaeria miniovina]KAK0717122.1 hypothetical protein B0T26DRAFT_751223 [Lasiosphaeria miniovina]
MSSLQIDEGGRRGRSRSPAGDRRDRDYDDDDDSGGRDRDRDRSRTRVSANVVEAAPYPGSTAESFRSPTEAFRGGPPETFRSPPSASAAYEEYERLSKWPPAPPSDDGYYPAPPRETFDKRDRDRERERDRDRDRDPRDARDKRDQGRDRDRYSDDDDDEKLKQRANLYHLPQKYATNIVTAEPPESPRQSRDSLQDRERERDRGRDPDKDRRDRKERERQLRKEKLEDDLAYGSTPILPAKPSPGSPPDSYGYAQPKPWEYAKVEEKASTTYGQDPRYSSGGLTAPGSGRPGGRSPSPGPSPLKSAMKRDRSPQPPTARMSTLTVNTGHHSASLSLSAAPPSPLLESYHGTYQSMSPMPSPLLLPNHTQVLEALSPIGSEDERAGDKKRSRRARFHDPVDDAARLAKALKGEKRAPETEPLVEILPGLTHEQVMELRVEYKRLVKTGSERKGVNIAKHIRARLKDEDPNLMKVCYATALGRWESEAYWANFWYHGDKTRRELLIEALMGRTNDEIGLIKDGFSDKKYANSLTKCMKTELKEDKFKKAVLMVLDQTRMEEADGYGRPLRLDKELVYDDVKQLHHAVRSDKGGESLMIQIVTQRSDSHLREVLKAYKETYRGANFAKDALKKSGNLVGEVLTHILNGVINKPVRDAMLLHHALSASKREELRRELLISRLVRYHWDSTHMVAVKRAFRDQYGRDLQDAVRDATSREWGDFCVALCITRVPDDVRRVERVDIHR